MNPAGFWSPYGLPFDRGDPQARADGLFDNSQNQIQASVLENILWQEVNNYNPSVQNWLMWDDASGTPGPSHPPGVSNLSIVPSPAAPVAAPVDDHALALQFAAGHTGAPSQLF